MFNQKNFPNPNGVPEENNFKDIFLNPKTQKELSGPYKILALPLIDIFDFFIFQS